MKVSFLLNLFNLLFTNNLGDSVWLPATGVKFHARSPLEYAIPGLDSPGSRSKSNPENPGILKPIRDCIL